MVSTLILDNHDFCSIMSFSQLSKRGNTSNTRHSLIVSTLKLEVKSLTELQEHLSNFGILINTSSSNEGSVTCLTFHMFLNFSFVRSGSLSSEGSTCNSLQSSK